MPGFALSVVAAIAAYLAMQFPPTGAVLGFFGAIPLSLMAMPFQWLPHQAAAVALVFVWPLLALLCHVALRRGPSAFRDSPFTIFAAAYVPFSIGVLRFLCLMQNAPSSKAMDACSAFLPVIS